MSPIISRLATVGTINSISGFNIGRRKVTSTLDIVKTNLILHLDAGNSSSYPGSGTTWTDLSGNGNNGTLVNGTSYNSANSGYLVFDGSNDGVNIGNINPTSGATFSAWIYIDGANANFGAIFARWGVSGNAFWIGTYSGDSSIIQVYFNGGLVYNITSVPISTWFLFTITHNGSTVKSYINTIEKNSASSTLISGGGTTSVGYDINRSNYPFKGNIAQVTTYTRAITETEIEQNYNALCERFGLLPIGSAVSIEYLVIAGGASGGSGNNSGGGGAGGYRTGTDSTIITGTNYTVTVGAGGASAGSSRNVGNNGSNSVFSSITSTGGGAGAAGGISGSQYAAKSGGSGGGGSSYISPSTAGSGNTPSTSPSQGNDGGTGGGGNYNSGGGGGAGTVGADGSSGGTGGSGSSSTITGSSITRAGGGGGGTNNSATQIGGTGGGGNGGCGNSAATAGTVNTGSGGGGGASAHYTGAAGGSGVVILRYSSTYTISNPGGGLTFTTATVGSDKVTTFTAGTGNIQFS